MNLLYPANTRRNRWIFNVVTIGLLAALVWTIGVWYGIGVYAALLFGSWGVFWLARRGADSRRP